MVKGGKRYNSMSNDGIWFAHTVAGTGTGIGIPPVTRETCTTAGVMQSQIKSSLSQALNTERYPKWKSQQKTRTYSCSVHDNRNKLQHNIVVFEKNGVGRKKYLNDSRYHSHFSLSHEEAVRQERSSGNLTIYQTEYNAKQDVDPTSSRRFPRNHQERSAVAAANLSNGFMWFGRHDLCPLTVKPWLEPLTA